MRCIQLLQVAGYHIDLRQPAFIQRRSFRRQFLTLLIRKFTLDTFLPTVRRIIRRSALMPHQRDDISILMPAYAFVYDGLSIVCRPVPYKIRPPYGGIFSRDGMYAVVKTTHAFVVIMLSAQQLFTIDIV